MMINQINLNDDELSVVQTSLQLTLSSIEKYRENNPIAYQMDYEVQEQRNVVKKLFDRLNKK